MTSRFFEKKILSRYTRSPQTNKTEKMLTGYLSSLLLLVTTALPAILSTPLDDYVWKYDENYKWVDMVRYTIYSSPRRIAYCFLCLGK
jgi:hypothetical protein